MTDNQPKEIKEPNTIWMILGFVFGILGGFLGVLIGGHFAFGPYDKPTKRTGRIMMVVGGLGLIIWKIVVYTVWK